MITNVYHIWQDLWKWLNGLTTKTATRVCAGGTVIGSLVFASFMLYSIHENTDAAPVLNEIASMHTEFVRNDSILVREIRTLSRLVDGVDDKVSKVILIVSANSNSDLIRRMVPYMEKVAAKEDIYSFILDMQRDIRQDDTQQRDTARYNIEVRKKQKQ